MSTSTATRKKILIVDDHPIVREGLGTLIDTQEDMAVCGHAEDADGALELIRSTDPDLVVVDLSLRDSSGLDLIKTIKSEHPGVRVLVSSMHDETLYAERCLRAGALGYIHKQEATRLMLTALRTALADRVYVSDEVARRIESRKRGAGRTSRKSALESLSARELEVFRAIGNGMMTAEIAERLKVSVKTVETYRLRIKQKLQVKTAADLARRAAQWVIEDS